MAGDILDEAYERLAGTGPEWGSDRLSNHGPMAAEVLVRRGQAGRVHAWLDSYLGRLDELPGPRDPITDDRWQAALGDGRRIGDWAVYLDAKAAEQPWPELLATWWPRLLPGIAAGATHGVIRVGHAVRALLAGDHGPAATTELARGLAFWAARSQRLPHADGPPRAGGRLDPAAALRGVPRIPDQAGPIAARLAQLAEMPAWPASISSIRPAATAAQVPAVLQDLVAAATLSYPGYAQASPVLLVHAATAPNAVLHTLPALPVQYWPASLSFAWAASAAIISAYAPQTPAASAHVNAYGASDPAAEALAAAAAHGDEHVIKFTDTAAEVYQRTGNPAALAAAARAAGLIGR
jgi:hypothetical protein